MNLKKYISKQLIMRFCIMLALVAAAAAFDMYHTANQKIADSIRKIPAPDAAENSKTFYCNQIPSFNLKTSTTELSVRFRFAFTQNKFLQKHYNLRTFQILKAETLYSGLPMVCSFHALAFNREIYESPDDTPPLV